MAYKTCGERKKVRKTVNGKSAASAVKYGRSEALFDARRLLGAQANVWKDGGGFCVGRYEVQRVSLGVGSNYRNAMADARKNVEAAGGVI